jgi:hypothetical protein
MTVSLTGAEVAVGPEDCGTGLTLGEIPAWLVVGGDWVPSLPFPPLT